MGIENFCRDCLKTVAEGIFLVKFAMHHINHSSMEQNPTASPEEVCRAVAADLRSRGITHDQAGKTIGKSRAIISNLLSSKKRFSKSMASLFSSAFGYNINYLLYGTGDMKTKGGTLHGIAEFPDGINNSTEQTVMVLACLTECAERILNIIGDEDAIAAWDSLTHGDFDGYTNAVESLSKRFNGKKANPILAKFVCDHVTGKAYIPIVSE